MPSLISELKRRNVFRVGTAYVLVSWLVAQAGDLLADNLALPEWFMPMLLAMLALGLPIALFLAWAFELTPEGVKKTEEVDRDTSITPSTGRRLNYFIIAALALAVVLLLADRFREPAVPSVASEDTGEVAPALEKSIAVLPFSNLSTDTSADSFVAGLHDDLLTQLSKINQLKVISRTSVLRYAGTVHNIKDIAAELGVATVMEGGVQRAGDRVRLNVQLIDAATDEHIWAETYDRTLTTANVFDVQSEITRQIATALQAALTPAEQVSLDSRPTDSLAAYEAYLNAKLLLEQRTERGDDVVSEAIAAARQSVELDPGFAEAWATLAHTYLSRFWYTSREQGDASEAWAAIGSARALQPDSTEVALMLGLYHYWVNLDYASALIEVDRVLTLESSNEHAWAIRGWILRRAGRWSEALEALKRAAVLDPNSVENLVEVGDSLRVLDRFAEAAAWQDAAEKRDPGNSQIRLRRAWLQQTTSGDNLPLLTLLRELANAGNIGLTERVDYVLAEARFGDAQRALDFIGQWAPGTIDVQYQFWPEDLLRAYVLWNHGQAAEAARLAGQALPIIDAAKRLEPNEADIERARAYALAIIGRKDEALAAAQRVRELYPRSLDDWGGGDYLFAAAETLAIAGQDELALTWLDEYASGDGADFSLAATRQYPAYVRLADSAGFAALVEKHGLVPADKSQTL
ncbi:MAG: tetratricopeptide repeat protein [Woeseiaceae bacterium]